MEVKNSAQEKIIKAKKRMGSADTVNIAVRCGHFCARHMRHENGEWLRRGFRTLRRSVCPDNDLRLFGMDMVART